MCPNCWLVVYLECTVWCVWHSALITRPKDDEYCSPPQCTTITELHFLISCELILMCSPITALFFQVLSSDFVCPVHALKCHTCVASNENDCNRQGSTSCPQYADACSTITGPSEWSHTWLHDLTWIVTSMHEGQRALAWVLPWQHRVSKQWLWTCSQPSSLCVQTDKQKENLTHTPTHT